MTADRKKAYRRGRRAEWLAALCLQLKGFRIIARRYKTPVGEIDLIARKSQLIIFVEVKARTSHQLALDAITRTAQRRIESAGNWWLSQQTDASELNWRYDVVTVIPRRWPVHYEDVW